MSPKQLHLYLAELQKMWAETDMESMADPHLQRIVNEVCNLDEILGDESHEDLEPEHPLAASEPYLVLVELLSREKLEQNPSDSTIIHSGEDSYSHALISAILVRVRELGFAAFERHLHKMVEEVLIPVVTRVIKTAPLGKLISGLREAGVSPLCKQVLDARGWDSEPLASDSDRKLADFVSQLARGRLQKDQLHEYGDVIARLDIADRLAARTSELGATDNTLTL